jgi:DNA-binding MarR family transcriptional regulator
MSAKHPIDPRTYDSEGEFPFATGDYVLHLLAITALFRDSMLDSRLRPLGLNISRYRAMAVLNRFGACTMTEVATFTGVDRTTLTRVADQLVASGWAERLSEAKDRRQVLLQFTEKGREVFSEAVKVLLEVNVQFLDGVPEDERRATARVLMRVIDNLAPTRLARNGIIHFSREGLESEDD